MLKKDGSMQMYMNYRQLSKATIKNWLSFFFRIDDLLIKCVEPRSFEDGLEIVILSVKNRTEDVP